MMTPKQNDPQQRFLYEKKTLQFVSLLSQGQYNHCNLCHHRGPRKTLQLLALLHRGPRQPLPLLSLLHRGPRKPLQLLALLHRGPRKPVQLLSLLHRGPRIVLKAVDFPKKK